MKIGLIIPHLTGPFEQGAGGSYPRPLKGNRFANGTVPGTLIHGPGHGPPATHVRELAMSRSPSEVDTQERLSASEEGG